MHRSGLRSDDVIIVTKAEQLRGLEGIRRDPDNGLFAVYVEDWWRRSERDEAYLIEVLRAQGFNGSFEGG